MSDSISNTEETNGAAGEVAISIRGVARDFSDGRIVRRVVRATDFDLYRGELVVLAGPSGSGKTTLLSMLGLVLRPSEGRIVFEGRDVTGSSDTRLASLRLARIGFVFQQHALVTGLSLLDNVLIALGIQGARVSKEARAKAQRLLEELGLEGSEHMDPRKLSGGQKQRGSIARALVKDPPVVLCDEPTSALDAKSGTAVLEILKKISVRENRAVVVVSHDSRVFPYADRLVRIENGELISDTRNSGASAPLPYGKEQAS